MSKATQIILLLRTLAILLVMWLAGCTYVRTEIEHVSHPMAGYPVSSKADEDALNQANVCLGKANKGTVVWFTEQCLGYKLGNQGFYGPEMTYTGRIGLKFDFSKE